MKSITVYRCNFCPKVYATYHACNSHQRVHKRKVQMEPYVEQAFSIVARYDSHNDIFWWADFSLVGVFCSDFFTYATADLEKIESEEDAIALEQAYKDILEANGTTNDTTWAPELYAARRRKCKPGSFIRFKNEKVKALFDAIDGEQLE